MRLFEQHAAVSHVAGKGVILGFETRGRCRIAVAHGKGSEHGELLSHTDRILKWQEDNAGTDTDVLRTLCHCGTNHRHGGKVAAIV